MIDFRNDFCILYSRKEPVSCLKNRGISRKAIRVRKRINLTYMITAIIQTEVKDFAKWKEIFDADQPNVEKAGARLLGVYTSVNNPNAITMIYEAPNAEIYDVLMSDPDRQKAIQDSGVIGIPVATFLNKI